MFRSLQIVCLSLAALCLAAVLSLSASCAEAKDRDIKVTGMDDKYLNLEVDGKKIQVPLPEGYVVADRELYKKLYGNRERKAQKTNDVLLCLLVDTNGNEMRKKDPSYTGYKYCLFSVVSEQRRHIFDERTFGKEIINLKNSQKEIVDYGNEERRKQELSTFLYDVVFENNLSISFINIENKKNNNKKYRTGFAETYFMVDSIAIKLTMHHDIYNQTDIDQLKEEAISYAKKSSQQ